MTISANFPAIRPSLLLDFANSQQLDPRITFSRPTTASYYDANTTALAEQNLYLYSQLFTNSNWNLNGTTLGTLTVAPDGTTTAYPLNEGTTTGYHDLETQTINSPIVTAGATYTISAYAQNVSGTYFVLAVSGSGYAGVCFNISTGAFATNINSGNVTYISSSIAQVGSSTWYRCSLTFSSATSQSLTGRFSLSNTTTLGAFGLPVTYTGTSNSINIWGAQLEQRSSVTAYNATTTTAITNYIPVLLTAPTNQARFDHDPVARTSLGLLIEQQSTNLLTYSSDYTQSAWGKSAVTINSASTIAPDGTQTAQKLVETATTAYHYVNIVVTGLSNSTLYNLSFYAKAAELNFLYTITPNSSTGTGTGNMITLSTGAQSNAGVFNGTSTAVGNGWFRYSLTGLSSSTGGFSIAFYVNQTSTQSSELGNGYSGIYIWGAQLEALAFPTSYIPTVASQVTRSADSASMTGTNFSSWFNNQQGSIFLTWEGGAGAAYVGPQGATISNGVSSTFVLGCTNYGGLANRSQIVTNGTSITGGLLTIGTNTVGSFGNSMISWNSTTCQIAFNGASTSRALTSPVLPTVNALYLGWDPTYLGANLNGYIKKFAYYPIALTSTNLVALTGS